MGKAVSKSEYIIRPYMPLLLTFLSFSVVFVFLMCREIIVEARCEITTIICFTVSLIITLCFCIHWSISENGVCIRLLWIPIYTIPWDHITDAQVLKEWHMTKGSPTKQRGIIISVRPAPAFCQNTDRMDSFLVKNFLKVYIVFISPKTENEVAHYFQKYFPDFTN